MFYIQRRKKMVMDQASYLIGQFGFWRQYWCSSMVAGFLTLFIASSMNRTPPTNPVLGLARDFILNPFVVPVKIAFLTVTF
jgi:hypothetical protein